MWLYNEKEFTSEDVGEHWGFVYLITNLETNRKYVGKKQFYFQKTKQVKKKKKKIFVDSDWKIYYGSNIELQEDVEKLGNDKFKREILYLCDSKSECSYWEAYEQFKRHAVISDEYYNGWLSVRVRKSSKLTKIMESK